MNWLDIVIAAVIVLVGLWGAWQGAIKAIFGIAGIIAGIFLAGRYYQSLAAIFSSGEATWARIAAYAIILIATLVVAAAIGWLVAKLVHLVLLGWLDRLLGFVLGAALGALVSAGALAILIKYFPGLEATVAHSVLARFLLARFPLLLALLPEEFDFIRDFFSPSRLLY